VGAYYCIVLTVVFIKQNTVVLRLLSTVLHSIYMYHIYYLCSWQPCIPCMVLTAFFFLYISESSARLTLEKDRFYILATKERVSIPLHLSAGVCVFLEQ
jgi:hypothetical protein